MGDIQKKAWYKSITVWANIVAVLAIIGNEYFALGITIEEEGAIVAFVNIVIRIFVTRTQLAWGNKIK